MKTCKTDISHTVLDLYGLITELYRYSWREQTSYLKRFGLTPAQVGLLLRVRKNQLTAQQLSKLTILDRSTVVDIVHRLEKRGLLVRAARNGGDRRLIPWAITEKGNSVLATICPLIDPDSQFSRTIQGLDPGKRETLYTLLSEIAGLLGIELARGL
ncbi:MAG: MarR family transcriptional regulator [Chloroflexi bacterium]|nr:MarR family transcriptional regulator [Chloroflexota bacterium]